MPAARSVDRVPALNSAAADELYDNIIVNDILPVYEGEASGTDLSADMKRIIEEENIARDLFANHRSEVRDTRLHSLLIRNSSVRQSQIDALLFCRTTPWQLFPFCVF